MLRLRHSIRLGREVLAFTLVHRLWWFLPLTLLLAIAAIAIAAGATAAPYTLYTLF